MGLREVLNVRLSENQGQSGNEMTPGIGFNGLKCVRNCRQSQGSVFGKCPLFTEVKRCVLYADYIFLFYVGLLFVSGVSYHSHFFFFSYYEFKLLECKIFVTKLKRLYEGFSQNRTYQSWRVPKPLSLFFFFFK